MARAPACDAHHSPLANKTDYRWPRLTSSSLARNISVIHWSEIMTPGKHRASTARISSSGAGRHRASRPRPLIVASTIASAGVVSTVGVVSAIFLFSATATAPNSSSPAEDVTPQPIVTSSGTTALLSPVARQRIEPPADETRS